MFPCDDEVPVVPEFELEEVSESESEPLTVAKASAMLVAIACQQPRFRCHV